jgi:hypothetical protein
MSINSSEQHGFKFSDYWQLPPYHQILRMQMGHLFDRVFASKLASGWQPLYLIATPRSGSTWLLNALNCFEEISMQGELLNPAQGHVLVGLLPPKLVPWWIRGTLARKSRLNKGERASWSGFKLFLDEFNSQIVPPNSRYVLLYRRNILEQFVSLKLAYQRNSWVQHHPEKTELPKITINSDEFLAFRSHLVDSYQRLLRQLPDSHGVLIAYEDMLSHQAELLVWLSRQLAPIVGTLTARDIVLPTYKQNLNGLDCVENLEELRVHLEPSLFSIDLLRL